MNIDNKAYASGEPELPWYKRPDKTYHSERAHEVEKPPYRHINILYCTCSYKGEGNTVLPIHVTLWLLSLVDYFSFSFSFSLIRVFQYPQW